MKILQINNVYKKGSTGKIVDDVHSYLRENSIDSYVAYGRGKNIKENNVYKFSSEFEAKVSAFLTRFTGLQYAQAFFATLNLIRYIKKIKPDVIHIHCINGYCVNIYKLFKFLTREQFPIVITEHAEFFHTGSCGHAFECKNWLKGCGECPILFEATKSKFYDSSRRAFHLMEKAINGLNNVIIAPVSDWLKERSEISPIMKNKEFQTVMNGLDTNIFTYCDTESLRAKYGLKKEEKIILHVTPAFSSPIKGGKYVMEIAKRFANKDVKIIIIGFDKFDEEIPSNVITIEHTNNAKELAAFYSMANVTLLTSKKETFSMICAESLCCGTPIIGFKAGGPETISLPQFSEFVSFEDVDSLYEVLNKWLMKKSEKIKISNDAKKVYDKEIMAKNYVKLYNKVWKKKFH